MQPPTVDQRAYLQGLSNQGISIQGLTNKGLTNKNLTNLNFGQLANKSYQQTHKLPLFEQFGQWFAGHVVFLTNYWFDKRLQGLDSPRDIMRTRAWCFWHK
jgi:hypothetical protein